MVVVAILKKKSEELLPGCNLPGFILAEVISFLKLVSAIDVLVMSAGRGLMYFPPSY